MYISQIFENKKISFSLEVFPPKKTSSVDTIYKTLAGVNQIPSDFISVTYGAGGTTAQKSKTGEICALIKSEYNIEPLPHLTCISSTKQDVMQMMDFLKSKQIQNILALRGDLNPDVQPCNDFTHASDLARFIKEYDPSFHVSGACYPEGHCESSTIDEDIDHLKIKIDSGVDHLISQLFFDNDAFIGSVTSCNKKTLLSRSMPVLCRLSTKIKLSGQFRCAEPVSRINFRLFSTAIKMHRKH